MKKTLILVGLIIGALIGFVDGLFPIVEPAIVCATLLIAGLNLLEERRAAKDAVQEVKVFLKNGKKVELPLHLLRRTVSRAELFGRIGSLPLVDGPGRFSLKEIGSGSVLKQINAVAKGITNEIIIPATDDEIAQFDLG